MTKPKNPITHLDSSEEALAEEMAEHPEFEALLSEALRVEAPTGMAKRLMDHASENRPQDHSSRGNLVWLDRVREKLAPVKIRHGGYAVAASLLLVFALVTTNQFGGKPGVDVERTILAGIQSSLPAYESLVLSRQVDPNIERNLRHMFKAIDARQVGDLGDIAFCETIEVNNRKAGVMVFPGDRGAITVVLLRGQQATEPATFQHGDLQGAIWPESKGTLAILGQPGESRLEEIESRVRRSVSWF
ncbi:MAG: hypothetical protein Kow006_05210 [Gammaproteobacteria bacterium]